MLTIKAYVYLIMAILILIMSFGCSNDLAEREKADALNKKMLRGYGNQDTTTHGVRLP